MSEGNGNAAEMWKTLRLGEICERIDYGFTASADYSIRELRFLRITDIQNGNVDWNTVPGCRISASEIEANRLRDGDIVFARTGATTGKSFLLEHPPGAVFASYLIRLRAKREIDPQYLSLYFQTPDYWNQIHAGARGGAQPNFNASMLASLHVPVCALEEQRRIAARLREQLSILVEARVALEAQLAAAESLPAAHLRAVFQSEEAKLWPRQRLDEVAQIVNGYGFSESLQGRTDLPFPFVKVSDMNAEGAKVFVTKAANTVDEALLRQLRARTYPAGTVIFPKVGGALLTNKKRVLGVEATFDNNVMGVVPLQAESEWIFRWAQTIDLRTLANVQALPSIRQSDVAALEIPMPDAEIRHAIAARLDAEFCAANALHTAIVAKLAELEKLPAALLRAAFSPAG